MIGENHPNSEIDAHTASLFKRLGLQLESEKSKF
jgi:hypothetical protein